jgi:hypothetical protein
MEVGVGPVGFDVEQQALIWAMWRRGDAIREMERTLGETLPRIRRYLRESGGMPPIPRRRRLDHLSLEEREEISREIAAGLSARAIAGCINRPSSTVSREIARNGGRDAYRALVADAAAFDRARRPKLSKLAANAELRGVVADKLDDDWSPQQIAHWLRRECRADVAMRISHESICRDLYMPSRKVFDATMFHRLRSKRSIRRPRGKKRSHGRGQILLVRMMPQVRSRAVSSDKVAVLEQSRRLGTAADFDVPSAGFCADVGVADPRRLDRGDRCGYCRERHNNAQAYSPGPNQRLTTSSPRHHRRRRQPRAHTEGTNVIVGAYRR